MPNSLGAQVEGTTADNLADVGKPIKVGGRYNSSDQTYADGDRADLQTDVSGRLKTADVNTADGLFASAARTASANSADQTNRYARGVRLLLNISASSGTNEVLDVKVQTKDSVSGLYFDIPGAAFAQKTGTGASTLTIYPGIAETANETVSDVLPLNWRVVTTIGGTDTPTFTFSLGASLIR